MNCTIRNIIMVAIFLMSHGPLSAQQLQDSGRASELPWSGYWWQHSSGGLTGPLQKYDTHNALTGAKDYTCSAQWEQTSHVATASESWFGHCHAWAASSVSEKEPSIYRGFDASNVSFSIGDQKGLLAGLHAQDISNSYGDRFGDGFGNEDQQDLRPDELWEILQRYIKRSKVPLILDLESGPEVWNYPIYSYTVNYAPAGGGWYDANLELVATDNNVTPDYVGTQYVLHNYTFRVQIDNGAIISGTGQWTGESVNVHPDFAWYPYVAVAENPCLDPNIVTKIVGFPVGGERATPDEDGSTTLPEPDPDNATPPEVPQPTPSADGEQSPISPNEDLASVQSGPPVDVSSILSPQDLVDAVLNRTSSFKLDIDAGRAFGGKYRPGEPIGISVDSEQSGYLYLIDVHVKTGELRLIYPPVAESNYIEGGQHYDIGNEKNPEEPFWLTATLPGDHDIKAIVTKEPIFLTGFQQTAAAQENPEKEKVRGARNQQNQSQVQKQPPRPQQMHMPPSQVQSLKAAVASGYQNGKQREIKNTKIRNFAQDVARYFVLPQKLQRQSK